MESFTLNTSESINEKVEEIRSQMSELIVEIKSNVQLVNEKKISNAKDTK